MPGLKLTPDQEKLWPPVEAAVRDFAKLRIDRANARMNEQQDEATDAQKPDDPVARLRGARRPDGGHGGGVEEVSPMPPTRSTRPSTKARSAASGFSRISGITAGGTMKPTATGTAMATGIAVATVTTGMAGRAGDHGSERL